MSSSERDETNGASRPMAPDDGDEIAALASDRRSPLEERIRHRKDGPYYIAPDSAEPLPHSIWQRIDLDVLRDAVDRSNENEHDRDSHAEVESQCVVGDVAAATPRRRKRLATGQAALDKVLGKIFSG